MQAIVSVNAEKKQGFLAEEKFDVGKGFPGLFVLSVARL